MTRAVTSVFSNQPKHSELVTSYFAVGRVSLPRNLIPRNPAVQRKNRETEKKKQTERKGDNVFLLLPPSACDKR